LLADSSLTTMGTFLLRELAPVITEVMTDTAYFSDFSTFLSLASVGNFSGSSGNVFYDWTIGGSNPVRGKRFFSCARCSGTNEQYRASAFVACTGYNFTRPFALRSQASEHCFPSDDR